MWEQQEMNKSATLSWVLRLFRAEVAPSPIPLALAAFEARARLAHGGDRDVVLSSLLPRSPGKVQSLSRHFLCPHEWRGSRDDQVATGLNEARECFTADELGLALPLAAVVGLASSSVVRLRPHRGVSCVG